LAEPSVRASSLLSSNTLGRYQIIREIARSNDIVYEAIDPAIGRRVALKELLLPPNLAGAQRRERIERFYREAKAAGGLSHPNIVTIHEVGEEQGRHFIAMEYLEGQTLREVLQVQGVLPIPEAVRVASAVAEALDYAHQHGVIHRDVKPDNVYLLSDGRIKLTDFGIARLMFEATLTADGQIFGTPSYMSPEQVAGRSIDPRSDLFSLGVMLYEMIAGRKPFPGDSVITITYNIMNMEPAPLFSVPIGIQRVVEQALAKDPARRPRTAGEMVLELKRALAEPGPPSGGTRGPQGPATRGSLPAGAVSGNGAHPAPDPQAPGAGRGAGGRASSPNSPTGLWMDALAGLRPEDWWFPRHRQRARPRLSPEMRGYLGAVLVAVVAALVLLFLFWSTMQAYREFQRTQTRASAAKLADQGYQAYRGHQYEVAIADFERAAQLDPRSDIGRASRLNGAHAAAEYGQMLEGNGNLADAGRWYDRAIRIDPTYALGHQLLARIEAQQNDEARAEFLWQRAMALAQARLQDSSSSADQRKEANAVLDQVPREWGNLLILRARKLLNANRTQEARDTFQRVIEIAPGTDVAATAQQWLDQLPTIPGMRTP
jgi:hypothetical protein